MFKIMKENKELALKNEKLKEQNKELEDYNKKIKNELEKTYQYLEFYKNKFLQDEFKEKEKIELKKYIEENERDIVLETLKLKREKKYALFNIKTKKIIYIPELKYKEMELIDKYRFVTANRNRKKLK